MQHVVHAWPPLAADCQQSADMHACACVRAQSKAARASAASGVCARTQCQCCCFGAPGAQGGGALACSAASTHVARDCNREVCMLVLQNNCPLRCFAAPLHSHPRCAHGLLVAWQARRQCLPKQSAVLLLHCCCCAWVCASPARKPSRAHPVPYYNLGAEWLLLTSNSLLSAGSRSSSTSRLPQASLGAAWPNPTSRPTHVGSPARARQISASGAATACRLRQWSAASTCTQRGEGAWGAPGLQHPC